MYHTNEILNLESSFTNEQPISISMTDLIPTVKARFADIEVGEKFIFCGNHLIKTGALTAKTVGKRNITTFILSKGDVIKKFDTDASKHFKSSIETHQTSFNNLNYKVANNLANKVKYDLFDEYENIKQEVFSIEIKTIDKSSSLINGMALVNGLVVNQLCLYSNEDNFVYGTAYLGDLNMKNQVFKECSLFFSNNSVTLRSNNDIVFQKQDFRLKAGDTLTIKFNN